MLQLESLAFPHDQRRRLGEFNPREATWIVSDLRAKFDVQRVLIAPTGFLSSDSVLRASELWKTLLTRLRPDLQIISQEFAVALISQHVAQRRTAGNGTDVAADWLQARGAAQTAYHYMTQLMPILAHPQGLELAEEWLSKNPESDVRWGHWLRFACDVWTSFVENGFVAVPWVAGVLVNELGFETIWTRPLIFDLGAELTQVEADLINVLSRFLPVTVLVPNPSWRAAYQKTLFAYDLLDQQLPKGPEELEKKTARKSAPRVYKKFTTMIAEVKEATAQIRKWLEEGHAPQSLAIAAPDIEAYWPALSAYLREEGIAVQKDEVSRLQTLPSIARWLAALRLRSGQVTSHDLEISTFQQAKSEISYERFRVLFSMIYDETDLSRDTKTRELYLSEAPLAGVVPRDLFIAWSLKALADSVDDLHVELIFKRLFSECPAGTALSLNRWLEYVQKIAARIEIHLEDGDPNGIACINLMSAENSTATHMMIVGLTESALRQSVATGILFSDTLSLSSGPGFHLASADHDKLEFEASWVLDDHDKTLHLCFAETDFAGAVQAPAWVWMQGAGHESRSVPATTRWDEVQGADWSVIAENRAWDGSRLKQAGHSIAQDLGVEPRPHFLPPSSLSVSASTIENYLDCPFVFAAKKLFRLSDDPALDLDVDASTRGSLMHAIFARLTEAQPMRFEYTDDELLEIIAHARRVSATELADERLWAPLAARYLAMARKFLNFEKEWRQRFPATTTIGRELNVNGWLTQTGALKPNVEGAKPHDAVLAFRGRIDRVDTDQSGHAAVIDYKSSAGGLKQFGSWIKDNQLQLLLYAMALEGGLTEAPAFDVMAAVYYVAKGPDRDTGLLVDDQAQGLFAIENARAKNHTDTAGKNELFSDTRDVLQAVLAKMQAGEYAPAPVDFRICDRCQWRRLCRAPHLN